MKYLQIYSTRAICPSSSLAEHLILALIRNSELTIEKLPFIKTLKM